MIKSDNDDDDNESDMMIRCQIIRNIVKQEIEDVSDDD